MPGFDAGRDFVAQLHPLPSSPLATISPYPTVPAFILSMLLMPQEDFTDR